MESVLLRLSQAGLHHWRRILWWLCLIRQTFSCISFKLYQIVKWSKWHEMRLHLKSHDPKGMSSVRPSHVAPETVRLIQPAILGLLKAHSEMSSKRSTSTSHEESSERSKLWFTTVPATVLSLGYYFCLKRNFEHWLSFAKGRSEFNRIHVHSCQESLGSVV